MDNDYELIYLAKESEDIKELIYKKYQKLINKEVNRYSNPNNKEDYINEVKLSLYNSVETYIDKAPYISYLSKCIENTIKNYNKKTSKENKKITISIEAIDNTPKEKGSMKYNPEKILYEELEYIELKEKILSILTWEEELIFNLKEQNYKTREISEITDKKLKRVYNIIDRIKRKVSKIMSNE